ncbi:MAG TPA: hypothetical protein VIR29_13705 [Anseongella sp.]
MNFKTNPLVAIVNLSLLILLAAGTANAQIKPDLSELDKKSGVDATLEGNLLKIDWDAGENVSGAQLTGRLVLSLKPHEALFHSIQLGEDDVFREIGHAVDPVFLLTVGKRDLGVDRNDTKLGWTIFFDNPFSRPFETYPVELEKQNLKVKSDGSQTCITIDGAQAGPFSGGIAITLFRGSPLLNMAAVMRTERDSLAIIYDAGLVNRERPWEKIFWADPQDYLQGHITSPQEQAQTLAVKYRTIIGQGE